MFPVIPWPSFLGIGVALIVGVIAFVIAGGLDRPTGRARSSRGPGTIRRAS